MRRTNHQGQPVTKLLIQFHFADRVPTEQVDVIARSAKEVLEATGDFTFDGEPPFFQYIGKTVVNYQFSYQASDD